jgi:hypothetical protein
MTDDSPVAVARRLADQVEKLTDQVHRLDRLVTKPRAVCPKKRGRRPDDDSLALVEMALLLKQDSNLRPNTAAKQIARGINDGNREDSSIAHTLVRKYNYDKSKYLKLTSELEAAKRLAERRPEFKEMLNPWFSARAKPCADDMAFLHSLTDEQVADFVRRADAEDRWALVCEMRNEMIREMDKM